MKKQFATLVAFAASAVSLPAELRAGSAVTDITPEKLPVIVNGSFLTRSADSVKTRLHARTLVLDDGKTRIAMVIADSCMMPRPLLDQAKAIAEKKTGIPADKILIGATHTHSAASCMGALGTDADPNYVPFLRRKLAESIVEASKDLQPVRVGWAVGDAADFTAVRRWIYRPDKMELDPFGERTVRANMHAARKGWENVTGPSGPEDPDLSMISLQTTDGKPFAVFANFSMHYFGDKALSADYFGLFCEGLKKRLAGDDENFVALLSHGCSGDIWRKDYMLPEGERGEKETIESYTNRLLDVAESALEGIEYRADADLSMAERRLHLKYRVPDKKRLKWAQKIVAEMGDRPPKDKTEVYAREQIILHERKSTDVVVQAVRIGDIGIATTPNETYALTGLKIKLQSPLEKTMVLDLTNGGDGYIPPIEQHVLGGYNTWAARSAGLEVQAERKITEAVLSSLEEVAGKPRRVHRPTNGPAAQAVLDLKPVAYWRMGEFEGSRALVSGGWDDGHFGTYEPGVVFFLPGPNSGAFCGKGEVNRCAHFAGGRLQGGRIGLGADYSVSMWFWNGMPAEARDTAGWLFARGGSKRDKGSTGDYLGLTGRAGKEPGRLVFATGIRGDELYGRTKINRWTWNHVVIVREGWTDTMEVKVYLNGIREPEIRGQTGFAMQGWYPLLFGGREDGNPTWEGRLDEVAIFDRALSAEEAASLYPRTK